MASINEKLNYINETKSLIKDKLNNLGSEIENETTFREYAEKIENLYEEWPKINDEDAIINLKNTKKGKMNLQLKGNTKQNIITGENLYNVYDIFKRTESMFSEDEEDFTTFLRDGEVSSTVWNPDYKHINNSLLTSHDYWVLIEIKEVSYSGTAPSIEFISASTSGDTGQFNTTVRYGFEELSNNQKIKAKITTRDSFSNCTCLSRKIFTYKVGTTSAKLVYRISILNEEPSIETFEYKPFISPNPNYPQSIEIVTGNNEIKIFGKNRLNINGVSATSGGLTWTANNDGSISISGTTTSTSSYSGHMDLLADVGQRHIYSITDYTAQKIKIRTHRTAGSYYYNSVGIDNLSANLTINEEVDFTQFYIEDLERGTEINMTIYPMLEALPSGSATLYQKFQLQTYAINFENLKLCKINDNCQDYIYKENNKWYKYEAVGEYTFTGNEIMALQNDGKRIFIGSNNNKEAFEPPINSYYQDGNMFCNKLLKVTSGNTWAGIQGISYDYVEDSSFFAGGFDISINKLSTLQEYSTAITGMHIFYIKKQPTAIPITDINLINQLNLIENAFSYDEQTNIIQENNDLPFIINAAALIKNSD